MSVKEVSKLMRRAQCLRIRKNVGLYCSSCGVILRIVASGGEKCRVLVGRPESRRPLARPR